MAEPYVVPSVLSKMRREKTRKLLVGDGVVYHDGEGHQLFGVVAYPGTSKVPVQIAGGRILPALPIRWDEPSLVQEDS